VPEDSTPCRNGGEIGLRQFVKIRKRPFAHRDRKRPFEC
jgi:hypothetical protein